MDSSHFLTFLAQITLLAGIASLAGSLMRRIGQPAVLGELLGGVLMGPTAFGMVWPEAYSQIFPADSTISASRDALLRVGMLFFMFAAGLEVNLKALGRNKLVIALSSLFGGAVPFVLGFGAVILMPDLWGGHKRPLLLALFMGTALSISALPVIVRILQDVGLMRHPIGVTVMTAAIVNDLIGWTLFAVILAQLRSIEDGPAFGATLAQILAYAALVVGLGRWVVQPLVRRRLIKEGAGGLLTALSVLVFLAALGAESLGFHAIFGAFLVGVGLGQGADAGQERRIHGIVQPFALSFFAPIYFVSVGLKADFSAHFNGVMVLIVFAIACLGKILGGGLGARLGGMTSRDALAVGGGAKCPRRHRNHSGVDRLRAGFDWPGYLRGAGADGLRHLGGERAAVEAVAACSPPFDGALPVEAWDRICCLKGGSFPTIPLFDSHWLLGFLTHDIRFAASALVLGTVH